MDRIPSWMKGYGSLVLGSAIRAWELAAVVTSLLCLGVAYVALGQAASTPVPETTKPAMREQLEMGHRLSRTLQGGCVGLAGVLVVGSLGMGLRRRL